MALRPHSRQQLWRPLPFQMVLGESGIQSHHLVVYLLPFLATTQFISCLLHVRSSQQEQDQLAATAATPQESQGTTPAGGAGHTQKHGYRWGGTHLHHRSNEGAAGSQKQVSDDFSHVDPEIMAQAKPLLTGNVVADRNIVRFYEARAQLLRRQQASAPQGTPS